MDGANNETLHEEMADFDVILEELRGFPLKKRPVTCHTCASSPHQLKQTVYPREQFLLLCFGLEKIVSPNKKTNTKKVMGGWLARTLSILIESPLTMSLKLASGPQT